MKGKPPSGVALTEDKVMRCGRQWQGTGSDTGSISLLRSAFYLSHVCRSFSWFHSRSWLTAFLMAIVVDVIQLLAADRAVERLEAVTKRLPSLETRNFPLSRTDCQCACMYDPSSSASKSTATCRMLFTRIRKPSLQAKRASMSSMLTAETQNR